MIRWIFAVALVASSVQAQIVKTASSQPEVTVDEASANEAQSCYRENLVASLTKSKEPRQLLVAALYAGVSNNLPEPSRRESLLTRAQELGADDPLVWWVSTLQPVCTEPGACSDDAALNHLLATDAQNAAAWMLELGRANKANDEAAKRVTLQRAAQANRFEDYYATLAKLVLRTAVLETQSSDCAEHSANTATDTAYRIGMAYAVLIASSIPPYQPLMQACDPSNTDIGELRNDCVAIGEKINAGNNSLSSQSIGLRLRERLLSDNAAIAEIQAQRRNQLWLMAEAGQVVDDMMKNAEGVERYTSLALEAVNEMELLKAVMTENHLTLQPPTEWQPHARSEHSTN